MAGKSDGPLEPVASFCHVEPANILVLTIKQAEDSQGLILRLAETAGQPTQAKITFALPIEKAWLANLAEENHSELPAAEHHLSVPVNPFQPVTVRIQLR